MATFIKKNVFRLQEKSEFGIAQRFSFRKYPKSALTYISVFSTFRYSEHLADSLGKMISKRSAFAFRSPARALAAGLPRQDHFCKTTFTKLATNRFFSTTKKLMKCVVN